MENIQIARENLRRLEILLKSQNWIPEKFETYLKRMEKKFQFYDVPDIDWLSVIEQVQKYISIKDSKKLEELLHKTTVLVENYEE